MNIFECFIFIKFISNHIPYFHNILKTLSCTSTLKTCNNVNFFDIGPWKSGIGYIYCVFYYDGYTLIASNIILKILVSENFPLKYGKIGPFLKWKILCRGWKVVIGLGFTFHPHWLWMNHNGFPMDAVLVDVGSQNPTKPGPGLCCPNLLH
jgi:hypothetical protein